MAPVSPAPSGSGSFAKTIEPVGFQEMVNSEQFSDVQIKRSDEDVNPIHAYRLLLAARSKWFKKAFAGNETALTLENKHIHPLATETGIEWCYGIDYSETINWSSDADSLGALIHTAVWSIKYEVLDHHQSILEHLNLAKLETQFKSMTLDEESYRQANDISSHLDRDPILARQIVHAVFAEATLVNKHFLHHYLIAQLMSCLNKPKDAQSHLIALVRQYQTAMLPVITDMLCKDVGDSLDKRAKDTKDIGDWIQAHIKFGRLAMWFTDITDQALPRLRDRIPAVKETMSLGKINKRLDRSPSPSLRELCLMYAIDKGLFGMDCLLNGLYSWLKEDDGKRFEEYYLVPKNNPEAKIAELAEQLVRIRNRPEDIMGAPPEEEEGDGTMVD
jgi:hypothetical protein